MRWLCIFRPHKWRHVMNFVCGMNPDGEPVRRGLWQCKRCKELSEGRVMDWPDEVGPKDGGRTPNQKGG
ncbi:MAG: hypothetical protein IMF11_20190 [Proteobacteria bacterium]|nr:hypothetical protein [Pseudomonadota bacterium]